MRKGKLTSFQIELIMGFVFVMICAVFLAVLKEPYTDTKEEPPKPKIISLEKPTVVEKVVPSPEEESQNAMDLVEASEYIQDDNLTKLLQTVIGFTKEDFDGSPPIHTQLMILLFMVNNYEIRESDGLDSDNMTNLFLDKEIAKHFLDQMFLNLDLDFEAVPELLSSFVYYEGDNIYLRRLSFNSERTKIMKATEIELDGEKFVTLHTITYMYDATALDKTRNLYECDVIVKPYKDSSYGYKIKSITNFKKL